MYLCFHLCPLSDILLVNMSVSLGMLLLNGLCFRICDICGYDLCVVMSFWIFYLVILVFLGLSDGLGDREEDLCGDLDRDICECFWCFVSVVSVTSIVSVIPKISGGSF